MVTLGQYIQHRSLLDEHPEIGLMLVGFLLLMGVILIVRRIIHGSRLKKSQQLLAAGQLAEAHRGFLQLARDRFTGMGDFKVSRSSPSIFDQALTGLEQTYAKAGVSVDLQPVRQLRQDLDALRKDKKFHSVWAGAANENLTQEGVKIKQSIEANAKTAFDNLPRLKPVC